MRSCSDVHNYLLEQGVAHEIVQLPALSTTVRRAAALLGVPPREVVKSQLFETESGPIVCLVPGDRHVDHGRLRAELGCAVKPAPAAEVVSLTGYRPGALPPCGLAAELPIIADPARVRAAGDLLRRWHDDHDPEDPQRRSAPRARRPGCSHRRLTATMGRPCPHAGLAGRAVQA